MKQLSMRDFSEVWGIYMAEIQKEQTSIIPNVYPSRYALDFNESTLVDNNINLCPVVTHGWYVPYVSHLINKMMNSVF